VLAIAAIHPGESRGPATVQAGPPNPHLHPAAADSRPAGEDKVSVLIVDDQPANLLAAETMLEDLDVRIIRANSGRDALRHLLHEDVAIILMDVNMPEMDGFEAAELIHKRKRSAHTPIIFLTASESADSQVFRGYSLGAVDYLVKPIVPTILRAKVTAFVDIHRKAEQIKRQMEWVRLLEQREHERQMVEAKARFDAERLQEELRLAREIQQKLFPAAPLPAPGLDLAGGSFPAEATGGDYFDYIPTADGQLAIVIGDVCGHGLGPALVMAELRAYVRAFMLMRTDVGEVVGLLNRAMCGDTDRFVTLFIAKLDPATRSLVYAGAGHLPVYIFGADGEVKLRLESTGMPLGVLAEADYATVSAAALHPGEMVVLLTDGVVEAHGPDEVLFGTERVLRLVQKQRGRPAREILHALFAAVRDHCGTAAQPDDMTAIIIKATPLATNDDSC
jgi:serine phosphatase RsbU (regulator of sigma subunit)